MKFSSKLKKLILKNEKDDEYLYEHFKCLSKYYDTLHISLEKVDNDYNKELIGLYNDVICKIHPNRWDSCNRYDHLTFLKELSTYKNLHLLKSNIYNSIQLSIKIENTNILMFVTIGIGTTESEVKLISGESITIFYSHEDIEDVDFINKLINKNTIPMKMFEHEYSFVGMLNVNNNGYFIRKINLTNKIGEYTNLDLLYGEGFCNAYERVIDRLINTDSGILLLYGDPGTGKTYTIKQIIKRLANKKQFIYISANTISSLLSPDFMSFITSWIYDNNIETSLVFIIEDAESLLLKRDEMYDSSAISNLLNLTSGILNDILGIQVIGTFNTKINNIDEAILREGRLIGELEFSKRTVQEVDKIYEKLEIDKKAEYKMSLADIFTIKNQQESIRFKRIVDDKKDLL